MAISLWSPLVADDWIVTAPPTPPSHEWVTEPANTTLATREILQSAALGEAVSFHVYLPPNYDEDPDARFPVLYWLHGSGAGIMGIPPLCNLWNNAIVAENIPPMIVVFPNGLPTGMWCDSKDGTTPMESILIEDLIPHVDANYQTIPQREGRLIEGFSMGGYGAARLGLKHADLFVGFSLMGAGPLQTDFLIDDPTLPTPIAQREIIFEQVYGSDAAYFEAQSPWFLAGEAAGSLPPGTPIRIVIGADDPVLPYNIAFSERLDALSIPHETIVVPDVGHNPLQTITGIGTANWEHYTALFSGLER